MASFYAELWSGDDETGPATLLFHEESATAVHYSPVCVEVDPPIHPGPDFWVLVNREMSSGGWPSLLGDNTPNWTGYPHSFLSDDFISWQPWIYDLSIRAYTNVPYGLSPGTWGELKTLFGGFGGDRPSVGGSRALRR